MTDHTDDIITQIDDPAFRRGVELLDAGVLIGLRALLAAHPDLARRRITLTEPKYFLNPSLLEFIAENPVRNDRLPPNIVEIAQAILDAGARDDQTMLDGALSLVASGRVPRECHVQVPLIDVLCDAGAVPDTAIAPAVSHGEFEAVDALLNRGARIDLAVAAALGRTADCKQLLEDADADTRHRALAWAAQFGRTDVVRLLLDAGEDPNRYNPVGCHAHSTPLHQAVLAGHEDVVKLLVDRGADRTKRDAVYDATPHRWAEHAGHDHLARLLEP